MPSAVVVRASATSQQEQESLPDIGQQLDWGRRGEAEDMRADQDAAKQKDDDLRNAYPWVRRQSPAVAG